MKAAARQPFGQIQHVAHHATARRFGGKHDPHRIGAETHSKAHAARPRVNARLSATTPLYGTDISASVFATPTKLNGSPTRKFFI